MQAKRPLLPELDRERNDPITGPIARARHLAESIFGGIDRYCLFEGQTTFERRRLLAGPGAYLRLLGPGGEIGVGLFVADALDCAADSDRPIHRFSVERHG